MMQEFIVNFTTVPLFCFCIYIFIVQRFGTHTTKTNRAIKVENDNKTLSDKHLLYDG